MNQPEEIWNEIIAQSRQIKYGEIKIKIHQGEIVGWDYLIKRKVDISKVDNTIRQDEKNLI